MRWKNSKTMKCVVGIGLAVVTTAFAASARAGQISGAISFAGTATPRPNADGTGDIVSDWTAAKSVTFFVTNAAYGTQGSFNSVPVAAPVDMTSQPVLINPPVVPSPSSAFWSVGGFDFQLTTLSEPLVTSSVMELVGTGTVSDGDPADDNTGTWIATFNTLGQTASFSSSFATDGLSLSAPPPVASAPLPSAAWLGLPTLAMIAAAFAVRKRLANFPPC